MRVAVADGRVLLAVGGRGVDVEHASGGAIPPDPDLMLAHWDQLHELSRSVTVAADSPELSSLRLEAPVPRARQVFGIALNYGAHADESGFERPPIPPTFTKFPSCIAGPNDDLPLPSAKVDWEVELVAVIGRAGQRIAREDAWSHVAGLTVGQDFSEREVQLRPPAPQFSLGKSFPGFGPLGPTLVSVDEFADPDDLELGCTVNGIEVQRSRTSEMIFSVPELIASLSAIVPLGVGDLIFTGTPEGVGFARTPAWFLAPGDEVVSWIENIGEIRNTCTSPTTATNHRNSE
jgi:2-keto-4-pentenoate hydratase/2-oxohepta-3-ene-1,7-dioic acid hydratase in catechol pathway